MPTLISFGLLPFIAVTLIAEAQPEVCHIHKLTLVSVALPRSERQSILRSFQGGTYDLDELAERIRGKLRDSGYALVEVGNPEISRFSPARSACDAEVCYSVHPGRRHRLGTLTFTSNAASVFPFARLRSQFHLDDGTIFNASEIARGLNNLRDLYGSAGYVNFGAIPKALYDDARHTISLTIDMDPGRPVDFGKLLMEGIEPRAGVAHELLASWSELKGKRYNSQLLRDWLKRNLASWPPEAASQAYIVPIGGPPPSFDVLLHFP